MVAAVAMIGCGPKPREVPVQTKKVSKIHINAPFESGSPEAENVLLVCNVLSADSIELTEYYARKRGIPAQNIVQISCPVIEQIGQIAYQTSIESPVKDAIKASKTRIDYIVLTQGIPFRLNDTWGYSVDAMLVAMNMKFEPMASKVPPSPEGIQRCLNPYFGENRPFNSEAYNMYLVTRLDGFFLADAKRMVERSIKAKAEKGLFYFDEDPKRAADSPDSPESSGWHTNKMRAAAKLLRERKLDVLETQKQGLTDPGKPLMGYVSWGSNESGFEPGPYKALRFLSGSIAETYVSTSARTLIPTDQGQTLVGDLIAQGVTGVKGYVSEPWTAALARVDILFDRYSRGYNLAESFYAASPILKWKDVVFGDPLCRPYIEGTAEATSTNK
jgi:uncharacterized protein (TIGR03790 family)